MAFDMNGSSLNGNNVRQDYDPINNNPFTSIKNAYSFSQRPPATLTLAEQAELEYELRYRGNMIVDQQRKIQQLEEELRQARDQMDVMTNQLTSYEQDRSKEKKKPQSRYWTPEEHQRFLEALQKYGHKDVKSISMHVATRNATQVRTHAQKYFLRLERERRKKEEIGNGEEYNSSSDLEDGGSGEHSNDDGGSLPISALTLPGSPAVNMLGEMVGTPPGTPGDSTPGGPSSPIGSSSPIPRRRRATSFITVAQARLAAQARDSVLVGLPPTWAVEDYDIFMRGLLALADKMDDVSSLCRAIREQYLPHHTPDEVELCYRNVLKSIKQKPLAAVGSPKRRRTNSRPEPLTAPINSTAVAFAPSTFLPPSSLSSAAPNSFPSSFQRHNQQQSALIHSSLHSSYGSSSPSSTHSSPLAQMTPGHMAQAQSHQSMRGSPYAEYASSLSAPLELPILSDLNISGLSPVMTHNMAQAQAAQQAAQAQAQAHQQAQQQQAHQQQHQGFTPLSPSPITPGSLWGSALPFSFDALMSGNVALPQAIPLHN